jgi:hypothetical protein
MSIQGADPAAHCAECERAVEVCGLCGEACGVEVCYRCALVELKESLPQPHAHGG